MAKPFQYELEICVAENRELEQDEHFDTFELAEHVWKKCCPPFHLLSLQPKVSVGEVLIMRSRLRSLSGPGRLGKDCDDFEDLCKPPTRENSEATTPTKILSIKLEATPPSNTPATPATPATPTTPVTPKGVSIEIQEHGQDSSQRVIEMIRVDS